MMQPPAGAPANVFSRQLPPEIWYLIVENLGTQWQRVALFVSRSIHDIAIRLLFSALKIYLFTPDIAPDMLFTLGDQPDILESLAIRSYDLLERCSTDPAFAAIVKDLTVVDHMSSSSLGIFEKKALTKALKAMPSLHTLTFVSYEGSDARETFEYIPPSVETLQLAHDAPLPLLQAMSHLKRYSAVQACPTMDGEAARVFPLLGTPIEKTLDGERNYLDYAAGLRHVAVNANDISRTSIRLLDQLISLELLYVGREAECDDLNFFLHHSGGLEELCLQGDIPSALIRYLPAYAANTKCAPNLRSLAIHVMDKEARDLSKDVYEIVHAHSLKNFIGGRRCLTRLFLGLADSVAWLPTVLCDVLQALPTLRVLGLADIHLSEDGWQAVAQCLPLELEALAVRWNTLRVVPGIVLFDRIYISPMLEILEKMPNLAFLHLYCKDSRTRIDPEQLVQNMPALCTLALRRSVWDVDHVAAFEDYPIFESTPCSPGLIPTLRDGEPYAVLRRWNAWKVRACGKADFQSVDHAWLFHMSILAEYEHYD
ncbi:hypothetical protein BD626DRAFT_446777 [Schizophyllum amplum]|uniref:Uncharacterized protein n=1 Tax=Schizophyllum amplum TaxID=97359 RepID=A0A550CWB2_9AGAR|nr:hypothetical protein BD626DRAFT_446777 [Auriculariopsis ampla]